MNRPTALQRRATHTLFELPEAVGFALAGGSALVAFGVVDWLTRYLDAFIAVEPADPPGDVLPLTAAVTAAHAADGWTVEMVRDHITFTRLLATLEGEAIEIDLEVDSPPLFPLQRADGVPSLCTENLAARKVLAALDRAEGWGFADLGCSRSALDGASASDGHRISTAASAIRTLPTPSHGSNGSATTNRRAPPQIAQPSDPGSLGGRRNSARRTDPPEGSSRRCPSGSSDDGERRAASGERRAASGEQPTIAPRA